MTDLEARLFELLCQKSQCSAGGSLINARFLAARIVLEAGVPKKPREAA